MKIREMVVKCQVSVNEEAMGKMGMLYRLFTYEPICILENRHCGHLPGGRLIALNLSLFADNGRAEPCACGMQIFALSLKIFI